jgi:hypothetical protein
VKTCLTCEGITQVDREVCASCGKPMVRTDEVLFPLRRGEEDAGHPLLGTLVDGKYRLTSVLGKGGMGTVFRAVHQVSLVPVALKVLHPRFAARAEYRRHFLQEARKAGRVVHEHSARIQDVGEAPDGTVYIAMELVEGATLHDWIHGEPPLSAAVVAELLRQITRALVLAHAQGLVHRDLTPRNVMVQVRDGRPFAKILDFGIARLAAATTEEIETTTSMGLAGFANPPYSAPEHLAGEDVDARTDLYSLGVIAYEMLTRRLPVDGRTRQEMAQRTLAGDLRPLRAPSDTPTRLVRLVERMLALPRERRPESAGEVLRVLDALLEPKAGTLRVIAVTLLLLALAVTGLIYRQTPVVYLRPDVAAPAMRLALASDEGGVAQVQDLRTEDLRRLQFLYSGFDGRQILVDAASATRDWVPVGTWTPTVVDPRRGLLVVDIADVGHTALLDRLAELSREGPVTIRLRSGDRMLGIARLRVDDVPPQLSLRVVGDGVTTLAGATELELDGTDDGRLSRFVLLVEIGAGDMRPQLELACDFVGRKRIDAHALLGQHISGSRATGPLALRLAATDAAGNTAVSEVVRFERVDLHVPAIRRVSGDGPLGEIRHGTETARMFVEIDLPEPRLSVLVRGPDPGDVEREIRPVDDGGANRIDFELPRSDRETGFASGTYEFRLRDAAGNRSTEPYRVRLTFVSDELGARFAPVDDGADRNAVLLEELIVTNGGEALLRFTCNSLYRPVGATLRSVDGTGGARTVEVVDVVEGGCTVVVPTLSAGDFDLTVDVAEMSRTSRRPVTQRIAARPQPPRLLLPATKDARYLKQLIELDVLVRDDQRLRLGAAWRVDPPQDLRLLQGRTWFGAPDSPTFRDLQGAGRMDLTLRSGVNVLAVEWSDPFGRVVPVLVGDRTPERLRPDGPFVVALFHHNDGNIRVEDPELRVEFDQNTRLVLRAPLPFVVGDEIRLQIDRNPLAVEAVESLEESALLTFVLPFSRLAAAAEIAHLTADDFAERTTTLSLPARLVTPAGDYELRLEGRTIRSNLTDVRLANLAPVDRRQSLPAVVADIVMIPVLGPGADRHFADPVPMDAPDRRGFRPQPSVAVGSLGPVYLQRGEMTSAQYVAIVAAFLAAPPVDAELRRALVHHGDPLGDARLTSTGLVPHRFAGDYARLVQHAAANGDRPVVGVDFFQAYTLTRLCGLVVCGRPELLRLPLGVELECAALGDPTPESPLNGPARVPGRMGIAAHRAARLRMADPAAWPPTETESAAAGDVVDNQPMWLPLFAIDFGVREWVLDLPFVSPDERTLLVEYHANALRHLEVAQALARGEVAGELGRRLLLTGTVRGLALGETDGLLDARTGARVTDADGPLPAGVPGVVRTLYLRRDGRGLLPDEWDPHLASTGLRLAGGRAFVTEVRSR